MAKLTTSDINTRNKAIARDFAAGNVTKASLARKYGVDEKTIRRAIKAESTGTTVQVTVKVSHKADKKDVKASVKAKAQKAAGKSSKAGAQTSVKATSKDSVKSNAQSAPTSVATGVKAALQAGKEVAYIITGDSIVMTMGNDTEIVDSSHQNYKAIQAAIVTGDYKAAYELMNISKAITAFTKGAITVKGGELHYGELRLKSTLVDRILGMMAEGDEGFKRLVAFLERLLNNPSPRSVEELWGFVSHLDVEIDDEGYLIGWKNVKSRNGRLVDCHTGKVPNDVGNIVEMPRFMVNDNKDETCSQGLHVAAWGYLSHFSGDVTLKVRVDPADVVSIPTDYNDQKMRAAKYEVIDTVGSDRKHRDYNRATDVKRLHVKVGERGEILSSVEI